MSVKVNLLPGDVQARSQANRARLLAGVGVLAVIAVLAALSVLQRGQINDANQRLAELEGANTALQADITALAPFADLEARASAAVDFIGVALGSEGSLSTVLQDLSAVLPPNAQMNSVTITLSPEELEPSPGGTRLVYGTITASGQVLDGVAPGVERLVIDLDRVAAFDNAYVTTSVVDEEGIAAFTLEVELGPEVLTGRYGLEIAATEAAS